MFAMWNTMSEPPGRDFVQVFQMFWPDGREFAKQLMPFKTLGQSAIIYAQINAIPIGQPGKMTLRTWVEEKSGKAITEVADYWIDIQH